MKTVVIASVLVVFFMLAGTGLAIAASNDAAEKVLEMVGAPSRDRDHCRVRPDSVLIFPYRAYLAYSRADMVWALNYSFVHDRAAFKKLAGVGRIKPVKLGAEVYLLSDPTTEVIKVRFRGGIGEMWMWSGDLVCGSDWVSAKKAEKASKKREKAFWGKK